MIGTTISQYKIVDKLGEGGMGVVYRAEDTKLKRVVALKFLPRHVNVTPEEEGRFLQEAQAAATLNHPNICTIHDIKEHEGQQFMVMECVEGVTLRRKIIEAPLKPDDAIAYALQIGDALQEAHGMGIVHRDIKSDNIMINAKNQIKVMDFGLAKLKGSVRLTKTSSTVGTLGYMAPEQIQAGDVDARSDIFSFGVVLFEMLTGKLPFRGEHDAAIMYSILNEECDSVQRYRQDVPSECDRIIHRALEKDPEDRYQHADDMVSELRRLKKTSTRVVRPEPGVQSGTTTVSPRKANLKLWIAAASILVLAGITGVLFFNKPTHKITSMAVLPFVNAGQDQSVEYLSDGFTESLINRLSKLPGVKMMSRNSVFRYKGKDIDPQVVGEELNVDAVLMGRIGQNADALSVSIELVNASDNSHIWGEQYERTAADIITLQNDIARGLSQQLGILLSNDQEEQIAKNATDNNEAYQLYLKGRYHWNKRTTEGFRKAAELFQSAIDKDPGYALAYAGLADCYNLMASYFIIPYSEAQAKAKVAANKAIELDATLAEPHTTLASIALEHDWQFDAAEREFRRSIELNPNHATAHHWYAEFLASMGRRKEALTEIQKAIEVDPLSPILYVSSGWFNLSFGNHQTALAEVDRALEIEPKFPRGLSLKALTYGELGKENDALRYAREAVSASGNGMEYRAWLAFALGRFGKKDEAEKILNEMIEASEKQFVAPSLIAVIYGGLGNKDKAFEWLEKVYRNHSGEMITLNLDPIWSPLRDDPRFKSLTRRVGLPE